MPGRQLKFLILLSFIPLLSFDCEQGQAHVFEIIQDGQVMEVTAGTVTLEKRPFSIRMKLYGIDGIFMSASFGRKYYGLKAEEAIPDFEYLNSKTMSEASFNSERKLLIDEESVCYYFYEPEKYDWHRFDEGVVATDSLIVGVKTVERFEDMDSGNKNEIAAIDGDIFLFFLATSEWPEKGPPQEYFRDSVRLTWK